MVLATGWWLMTLHSSSQVPSGEGMLVEEALQESSSAACDGTQEGVQEDIKGTSACVSGASQAGQLARDESTGDLEGNTATATGFDPADDSLASEDIRYIDIYDPSTWPIEISTDDEPVDVEQIDLYDPDTWPSAEKGEAESASSGGEEIDVYDPATWPQTIGSAASGDAIVPIDPYDATTWPKE